DWSVTGVQTCALPIWFELAKPKASTPEERKALAEEYFDHWFTSAGRFYAHFEFDAARGWNAEAAFELHQATERYYAAALLVFTRSEERRVGKEGSDRR